MLNRDRSILVIIDVQGRLSRVVDEADAVLKKIQLLLAGMKILEVPVIFTEQIPEKLGPTREELREFITETPIKKTNFSCCCEPDFSHSLEKSGRTQVILCGIETHICIYQTAMQLLDQEMDVTVITDAVSSRNPADNAIALRRMECAGVKLTRTEMLLFELLGDAGSPKFKAILRLVK